MFPIIFVCAFVGISLSSVEAGSHNSKTNDSNIEAVGERSSKPNDLNTIEYNNGLISKPPILNSETNYTAKVGENKFYSFENQSTKVGQTPHVLFFNSTVKNVEKNMNLSRFPSQQNISHYLLKSPNTSTDDETDLKLLLITLRCAPNGSLVSYQGEELGWVVYNETTESRYQLPHCSVCPTCSAGECPGCVPRRLGTECEPCHPETPWPAEVQQVSHKFRSLSQLRGGTGGMVGDHLELFNKKKEKEMKLGVRCRRVRYRPPPPPLKTTTTTTTTTTPAPRPTQGYYRRGRQWRGRGWWRHKCYFCESEEECDYYCRPRRYPCRLGSCYDKSDPSIYEHIPGLRRKYESDKINIVIKHD